MYFNSTQRVLLFFILSKAAFFSDFSSPELSQGQFPISFLGGIFIGWPWDYRVSSFIILYFTLPDFPPKQRNLKYHQILYSMGKYMLTEPLLVQTCLNGMLTFAVFASFWTTLTFLLGNEPYNYSRFKTISDN